MENLKDYKSQIFSNISKIEKEVAILKQKYDKFFSIDHIFSNENGGKTRLNRQLYNENHEDIQTSIMEINYILEESLGYLKEELKMLRLENAELKMERDMLKKAAAYFAKLQK